MASLSVDFASSGIYHPDSQHCVFLWRPIERTALSWKKLIGNNDKINFCQMPSALHCRHADGSQRRSRESKSHRSPCGRSVGPAAGTTPSSDHPCQDPPPRQKSPAASSSGHTASSSAEEEVGKRKQQPSKCVVFCFYNEQDRINRFVLWDLRKKLLFKRYHIIYWDAFKTNVATRIVVENFKD